MPRGSCNQSKGSINPLFGPRTGAGVTPVTQRGSYLTSEQRPLFVLPGHLDAEAARKLGYSYRVAVEPCNQELSNGTWYIVPRSNINSPLRQEACRLLADLDRHSDGDFDLDGQMAIFWLPVYGEIEYRLTVRRLDEISKVAGVESIAHGLDKV